MNQKRLVLQHSPPWLWMPDKASELTCRCRQRYKDAMASRRWGLWRYAPVDTGARIRFQFPIRFPILCMGPRWRDVLTCPSPGWKSQTTRFHTRLDGAPSAPPTTAQRLSCFTGGRTNAYDDATRSRRCSGVCQMQTNRRRAARGRPWRHLMSKRFRIAFSFSGDKRKFVAEIADILGALR